MDPLRLSAIGARGVDIVNKPQDLDPAELSLAQNAEVRSQGGQGALDQRPGMTRINNTPISGSASLALDVTPAMLYDKTAYLYAGMFSGSTHNWRASSDGTTWANDDTPVKPKSTGATGAAYFKNFVKCATVNGKLYFVDNATPPALHEYDGVTDRTLTTIPTEGAGIALVLPTFTSSTFMGDLLGSGSIGGVSSATGSQTTTYKYATVPHWIGGGYGAAGTGSVNGGSDLSISGANNTVTVNDTSGSVYRDLFRIQAFAVGGGSGVSPTGNSATLGKIGTLPSGSTSFVDGGAAAIPFGPGDTIPGLPSDPRGTTYTYKLVARAGKSFSSGSTGSSVSTGSATLSATNYIKITPAGPSGSATSYDVYRTVGGPTQGKIGSIGISAGAFTTGNGSGLSGAIFSDAGLVGDGTTPPTVASGISAGTLVTVLDMTTDGTNLFLATHDSGTDPQIAGRILQYSIGSGLWMTIKGPFPSIDGNGCPGTLAFVDGALTYGTYIGTTTGSTAYLTTTGFPMPAGGINEVHTNAAQVVPLSIASFSGSLFVGCAALSTGVAALVLKRVPVQTWSTARTGPATAQYNAYTSLAVFNGKLFAGWTSGGGATAAVIESTSDGVTWATDVTLDVAEVVCQMVVFNSKLYVVLGRTGAGYNTVTVIMSRDTAGVWTVVDDPADDLAGCLGVVYK